MVHLTLLRSLTADIGGDGLVLRGDLSLNEGFRADGAVRLLGAEIGGDLNCRGGTFRNPDGVALGADGAKVTGGMFLNEGFSAEGEVRLLGAEIGGDLYCGGGTFRSPSGRALSADRAQVCGNVSLNAGFLADGEVRLVGAKIDGALDWTGPEFAAGGVLNAEGANVKGGFFWREVSDPGANSNNGIWLNLSHASFRPIGDDQISWPAKGRLVLDGFEYSRIAAGPVDAKSRLEWLARQADGFWPQPYQQLAKVLRERGDDAGAREVLIRLEDLRRRYEYPKQPGLSWNYLLGLLQWLWRWVLKGTIAYGYRPWYALVWGSAVIVMGACLLGRGHSDGIVAPSDRRCLQTLY